MKLSLDRLSGLVAGVFALRALDGSASAVALMWTSIDGIMFRVAIAFPTIAGALVSSLLCWWYVKERQERWQHFLTIVLLLLGLGYGAFLVFVPTSLSQFTGGLAQMILSAAMIGCVVVLMKKKPNQALQTTRLAHPESEMSTSLESTPPGV